MPKNVNAHGFSIEAFLMPRTPSASVPVPIEEYKELIQKAAVLDIISEICADDETKNDFQYSWGGKMIQKILNAAYGPVPEVQEVEDHADGLAPEPENKKDGEADA